MDVRICFRITMAGDNGEPKQQGISLNISNVKEGITAEQLGACINKQGLIASAGLIGIVTPEQMELISAEEFDKLFGDEDMVDINA